MRPALVRGLCRLAGLFHSAGRGLAFAAAGLMRRADLLAASRRGWDVYSRSGWTASGGLHPWEREFYFAHLRPGDRVLLVGCGAGRDLVPLLEAGHEADGLDLSAEAVEACRANLERRGLRATLHAAPVEEMAVATRFDAIVFSWFCFSYVAGAGARVRMLARLREALLPGGRILLSYVPRAPGRSRLPPWLGRLAAFASGSDWRPEYGDTFEVWGGAGEPRVHFEHAFAAEEAEAEARAAGLAVASHETGGDDGRLVLVATPSKP